MNQTIQQSALNTRIDASLSAFLDELAQAAIPYSRPLLDEIRRIVSAGGKRIRPRFCYWGHVACHGDDSDALIRASAAMELLHTFAIIHDDLVDGSKFRRGRPTSQESFSLQAESGVSGAARFGWGAALLTGDFALVAAEMCLMSSGFSLLNAAKPIFDRMRLGAIAGEFRDVTASLRGDVDPNEARAIAVAKSGRYSVAEPLLIGAALAGASDETLSALSQIGLPIGEAFQLTDDILSVFGDPAKTGKDADTDLREGKQTLLIAALRQRCSPHQLTILQALLGNPNLSDSEAQQLRDLISSSGALGATQATVQMLKQQAEERLAAIEIDETSKRALQEMICEVTQRDA